ncbi:hypothetical protein [Dyadobacter sp. CY356]|uniref:hypothetical protein n=1 Tax=Dyadobacter sp. CY356 TaxID=2906442 RepID=UPI001F216C09|nr:hypothetical protein [Dyadobacter sp. CY356]MCF0056823.1 hypothetical protein [Dyadobacter sp. CY356]
MVVSEPNIKNLSKSFLTYSIPTRSEKKKEESIPQELLKLLKVKVGELKDTIEMKEERIEKMISVLEKITWVTNPDAEEMQLIEGIVEDTKTYLNQEMKFVSTVKPLVLKGFAKKEFRSFLGSVDDLREALQDVQSVFYTLPNNKDFYESLKDLEDL